MAEDAARWQCREAAFAPTPGAKRSVVTSFSPAHTLRTPRFALRTRFLTFAGLVASTKLEGASGA